MSIDLSLEDAFVRHQILIQRYAKGREREAMRYIKALIESVQQQLGTDQLSELSQARLQRLLYDIELNMVLSGDNFRDSAIKELLEFAEYEVKWNYDVLRNTITDFDDFTLPTQEQIESIVYNDTMTLEPNQNYTISAAIDTFNNKKQNQIIQSLKDNATLALPIAGVIGVLSGLKLLQGRQAATLSRTQTNRVAVLSRQTTMRLNSSEGRQTGKQQKPMSGYYKWVAVLDSLTSYICISRDGRVYKDIDKNPKPPAHYNCRSTITYLVNDKYNKGGKGKAYRTAIGEDGKEQRISDTINYPQWLRRQPAGFQDEVLGIERGEMFRRGTLSVDRFVDENGRSLTLPELRDLETQLDATGSAPSTTPDFGL